MNDLKRLQQRVAPSLQSVPSENLCGLRSEVILGKVCFRYISWVAVGGTVRAIAALTFSRDCRVPQYPVLPAILFPALDRPTRRRGPSLLHQLRRRAALIEEGAPDARVVEAP